MGRLLEINPRRPQPNIVEEIGPEGVAMDAAPPPPPPPPSDSPATRIAKLIPGEVIAGYVPLVAAAEAIANDPAMQFRLSFIAFLLGLVATPIYLYLTGRPKTFLQWYNVVISTIAFVLWAYLLGGPFAMEPMVAYLGPYNKQVASFVVGAFTWIVGLLTYATPANTT